MHSIPLVAQSSISWLAASWPAVGSFDRLGWLLAQASVIAAAALLILRLCWRIQPRARATLACTAMALMTLVPITALLQDSWWSFGSLLLTKTTSGTSQQDSASATKNTIRSSNQSNDDAQSAWWAATRAALTGTFTSENTQHSETIPTTTAELTNAPVQPDARSKPTSWRSIVLVAWLACILLGFARLFVGLWAIRRMQHRSTNIQDEGLVELLCEIESAAGLKRPVQACENAQINTAAVIGWRRPTLLLPSDWRSWTEQELRAIVSHEVAHIRRDDFLTTVLAQAALALHLYNPLAHLLFRQLRLSQELAADALAANLAGGRRCYTQVLAAFALRQAPDNPSRMSAFPSAAQAFLPTRHTFVRRLEMLKDLPRVSTKAGAKLSLVATVSLVIAAFFASGLRPSTLIAQEAPVAAGEPSAASKSADRTLASYAPDGVTHAVVHIDVQKVLSSGLGKALIESESVPEQTDSFGPMVKLSNVESALVVYMVSGDRAIEPMAILRLRTPLSDEQKATQAAFKVLDDRTFAYHPLESIRNVIGKVPNSGKWAELLAEQGDASIRIAGNIAGLRSEFTNNMMRSGGPALVLLPLWEKVDSISMGINLQDTTTITATMHTDSPKEIAATTQAVITLGKNYVQVLPRSIGGGGDVAAQVMASALSKKAAAALDSAQIRTSDDQVDIQVQLADSTDTLITYALPAIKAARVAAARAQSTNNLKQIALAMHNYAAAYRHLPAAIVYDRESGVPRSWRVEILPFIEHAELYQQYKKDEPWDSPANLKVLEQMPKVFAAPGAPNGKEASTETSYLAIVSKDGGLTPRADGKPPKFTDFTDGTSNTVVYAETNKLVPWTQPVDATETAAIPQAGSFRTSEPGTIVAFADGSVRFISASIDAGVWAAMLTRSGGEIVDLSQPRSR